MLENLNYIHWEDVYKENFLPAYNNFIKLRSEDSSELNELTTCYLNLFEASYKVLRIYMANKGIFVTPKMDVIKTAYKVYLIDNGQIWIDVLSAIETLDKTECSSNLSVYFDDKFIKIYTDLNERLEKELKNVF